MRPSKETVKKEAIKLQGAVREKALEYLLVAFGLVAGLAWNDAVKTLIETLVPLKENTVLAKFLYAFVVTAVVVVLSLYLARVFKQEKDEK